VRTTLIVFLTPDLNQLPGFGQRGKPVRVQALIAERSVEAFDESIVGRLAGPGFDTLPPGNALLRSMNLIFD
jgi:hypothetical protein